MTFDKEKVTASLETLRTLLKELDEFRCQIRAANKDNQMTHIVKIRDRNFFHPSRPIRIRNQVGQYLASASINSQGFHAEWSFAGIRFSKDRSELAQKIATLVGGELTEDQLELEAAE